MYKQIKNNHKKIKYLLCLFVMLISAFMPLKVLAVDYGFYSSNDILFHDPNACGGESTTSEEESTGGPIVAIGDSILQSAQSGNLEKKLKDKGYTDITIDAVRSRSLASPGVGDTTGLEAIDTNKDKISSAGTVLMVLGTNYDGNFESNLKKAIRKINDLNSNAKIFWTNVGIKTQTSNMKKTNDILNRQKTALKYTIIDWHKAVVDNPDYIGGDDLHPTTTGAKKLSALIADNLGSSNSGSGSGAGGAPTNTGTTQQKNAAVVWNTLTSKGLSSEQAAGVLGNLQAESGIEPAREQNTPSGSITKHMKIDGRTGYGIAQWTAKSRQKGLHEAMVTAGKSDDTDITVQAEYLWHELSTDYKSVLKKLKKTSTIRAAAVVILLDFESPANQGGDVQDKRTEFARKWFNKFSRFGSGNGVISGTNCTCTDNSNNSSQPVIVLDPAHSGETTYTIDQETGIMDAGYYNGKENKDTFNVAKKLKTLLEKNNAYKVILTKDSPNDSPTARQRVTAAENANADLAISIHTDSGFGKFGNRGQIYYQFVGGYRLSGKNTKPTSSRREVKYTNSQTAAKSKDYANKIQVGRSKNENNVSLTKANFNSRGGNIPPGNLPIVQLFSDKVPWIYNESGATSKSAGISDSEQDKYAQGLYDGIISAVPPGSGSGSSDCNPSSSGDASAIVDWALKMSWNDTGHGINDPKPLFKEWYDKIYNIHDSYAYSACNQFVAVVMRASGADKNYAMGVVGNASNPSTQVGYATKKSNMYEKVANPSSTKNLQPGDIMMMINQHTWIYVGDQEGGNIREGSLNGHVPQAGSFSWYSNNSNLAVFRLK